MNFWGSGWKQIDSNQKDNNGKHKLKMIHEAYGLSRKRAGEACHQGTERPDNKRPSRTIIGRGNQHQVTLNVFDGIMKKVFQENAKKEPKDNGDAKSKQRQLTNLLKV